ncbi:MAG: TIGR02281 family clan AA aspartic protease [Rhodobacteraceae bacterium]|nr:TIGR02281 family clan AA aspartic protease [Paracoccaceae bacterium]
MQIWALILIVYFLGAFLLRDNFSDLFLGSGGVWWVALIAIGLVATAFAGAIRNLMGSMSEERHRAMFALAALFCIGIIEFINVERNLRTEQIMAETAALALVNQEVSINRSWDGQFRVIAQVNGRDVGLMVDTGASLVFLRYDDAVRLGIPLDQLDYSTPMTTVNGKSFVAKYNLGELTIGDVTIQNVRAAIAQEGELHSSLLGMSFLEKLEETVIQKDRMILRK